MRALRCQIFAWTKRKGKRGRERRSHLTSKDLKEKFIAAKDFLARPDID